MDKRAITISVLLCLTVPGSSWAANDGSYSVTYDGGTLPVKVGHTLKLYFLTEGQQIQFSWAKDQALGIPASAITEVSYGQDVHRRVGTAIGVALISFGAGAFLLLVKSKKHFVGVTWAVGDVKGGFAMQCDKNDYRGILAGLEGMTGKKAVNSENLTVKN